MILWAFIALLCLNGWTFLRFREDKLRAMAGQRRIPEADLLSLSFLGGWPGALAARHVFRHKTKKQPFSTILLGIAFVEASMAAGLAFAFLAPA